MKLKLAKVKNAYEETGATNGTAPDGYTNHVTKLLKDLVEPWAEKVDRVIAADSYFSSMKYEEALEEMVLGFVGVDKLISRQYPIANLKSK